MDLAQAQLKRVTHQGVAYWTDPHLFDECGITIAFSERSGGVSPKPFESLNLGLHVGDELENVWENRRRLFEAAGIAPELLDNTASAHQTHSNHVARVQTKDVGNRIMYEDIDAFICNERDIPLLLCYADCVPVILVNTKAPYSVSVVHSGWKGTLLDVTGEALDAMVEQFKVDPKDVLAYIGPYVCGEHLVLPLKDGAKFYEKFDSLKPEAWDDFDKNFTQKLQDAPVRIDMEKAIRESLTKRGVQSCAIQSLLACSAEKTKQFFSYRTEMGNTGRHGALAMLTRVS